MNEQLIASKIQQLNSEPLKQELLFFLDYLLTKQNTKLTRITKKIPRFGYAKGTFKMADDFNARQETQYLLSTPANAERLLRSLASARNGKLTQRELITE